MTARTPQGSVAWAIALVAFPYASVPLFWIFGRDRFTGYSIARRDRDLKAAFRRHGQVTLAPLAATGLDDGVVRAFESLANMRFRGGNRAKLCINGDATFDAIFRGLDAAKDYALVQFYIVRDDALGRRLKERLLAAAKRGVRIYFLYDEIGTYGLPQAYVDDLCKAGIDIRSFRATKKIGRFQINFRNHRKIVVIDGEVAFIGGHNVGDEYLGQDPKLGFFRDTHVEIRGPAALQAQVSFVEDWHWVTNAKPLVRWEQTAGAGQTALVLPSGPADGQETCGLFYLQAIESAKQRIWIATPYFVPDPAIVAALQLAAKRGVEVKIIVPFSNDNILVQLAIFSFLTELLPNGIQILRYKKGFLHQKVLLIDDHFASVGSANFDLRSFRLNFEITVLVADVIFARQVAEMLQDDFQHAVPFALTDLTERKFPFRLAVQMARLLSPVL